MGLYHEHFMKYAAGFLQKPFNDLDMYSWTGDEPFWRLFGVSKATYREMKLGYRQGRLKRSMPVREGAAELSRAIRAAGAEVWVCTTRPYLSLDNIEPDTTWWLRRNGIQFDGLLFGPHKYRDLAKMMGRERVLAVLDDEPEHVARARSIGLNAFLIDRNYNRTTNYEQRLGSLGFARGIFLEAISEWRKRNHV